jgi:hypothetical protein
VRHRGDGDTRRGPIQRRPTGRARRDAERAARVRRSGFERIARQPIIGQRRSAASFASASYARGVRDLLESIGYKRRQQLALGRELPAVAGAGAASLRSPLSEFERVAADYPVFRITAGAENGEVRFPARS